MTGRDTDGSTDRRPPHGDWLGTPHLTFHRADGFAEVTVDRPEARNAMTAAMYFGVRYAVDRVNDDPSLHGLLLTGTGDVFIPGGDLGASSHDGWPGVELLGMDAAPFNAIRHSRKPVVSAVNGIAQGGGLLMAILSDVAVASEHATFRAPELYRGIADSGYAAILPAQIGPARAKDMLHTGRVVDATTAEAWGLVSRIVPHDDLVDTAREALSACARCAPSARNQVKRIINEVYGHPERMTMDESLAGPEALEGWHAFRDRRQPSWIPANLRANGRL